jgi:hypothetical protein
MLAGASPAYGADESKCAPKPRQEIVAENDRLIVFGGPWNTYTACERRTGRRMWLGYESGGSTGFYGVSVLALNGPRVAYHRIGCSRSQTYCSFSRLLVAHVPRRERRIVQDFRYGQDVEELVINRNGSVAWIDSRYIEGGPRQRYTLRRFDSTGRAVLASGDDEAGPHDLTLMSDTISWTQGTETHSAPLR